MKIPGTLPYVAPEVLHHGRDKLTTASDIWAIGCIGYELFTGRPLFESEAMIEHYLITGDVDQTQLALFQPYPAILKVIRNCVVADYKLRWNIWRLLDNLGQSDGIQ